MWDCEHTVVAVSYTHLDVYKRQQDAYAELEKGKMTAVNELTRGEVTLSTTKTQLADADQKLAEAQEPFDQARDAAYKKADLSGMLTADMLGNLSLIHI